MSANISFGKPFINLFEVESTNNYAMGMAHAGVAQHGTAVFTTRQTKGKGQRDKQWMSEPGKNVALSIIAEPNGLATSEFFRMSMAAAVATHRLFAKYAGDETRIKWPNDIIWRDRKAAGILIENVVQANQWRFSIIGIGLNVNQVVFGAMQKQAVSLKQITGKELDPETIAYELCNTFHESWMKIYTDPVMLNSEYRQHLYKLNEEVKFRKDNRVFEAVVKDVTSNGRLVVQHSIEEMFDIGEVEWVMQ